MKYRLLSGLLAGLFSAVLALALPAQAADWNHNPADAVLGPSDWGNLDPSFATCGAGRQQSPVDISATTPGGLPPLEFAYRETALEVENNGHVIEVPYELGSTLRIGSDVYRLLQFHFHTPSEHTVGMKPYDMELHLVHMNGVGQLAVVGVLLRIGDTPNPVIDLIFANAPAEEGTVPVTGVTINARDVLPGFAANRRGSDPVVLNDYHAYPGSLTTPPCSEGVRWFVLKQPVAVSAASVERMHERVAHFPHYNGYPNNNRPVQPLNGRAVLSRPGR